MESLKIIVRAILAIMVVLTTCVLAYLDKVSAEAFVGIALIVIQFFFGDKSNGKKGGGKKEIK